MVWSCLLLGTKKKGTAASSPRARGELPSRNGGTATSMAATPPTGQAEEAREGGPEGDANESPSGRGPLRSAVAAGGRDAARETGGRLHDAPATGRPSGRRPPRSRR